MKTTWNLQSYRLYHRQIREPSDALRRNLIIFHFISGSVWNEHPQHDHTYATFCEHWIRHFILPIVHHLPMNSFESHFLIVSTGMIRSGSTWLYNALRELLAYQHGVPALYSCWISDFSPEKANQTPYTLVKVHEPNYILANSANLIFSCHRDLRDVAVSILDIGWIDNLEKAYDMVTYARECHDFWLQLHAHNYGYEEIAKSPKDTLLRLAQHLSINISDAGLENINSTLEKISSSAPSKGYNSETLVHSNHVADGTPGRWRKSLDERLAKKIADHHGDWLLQHGYTLT